MLVSVFARKDKDPDSVPSRGSEIFSLTNPALGSTRLILSEADHFQMFFEVSVYGRELRSELATPSHG